MSTTNLPDQPSNIYEKCAHLTKSNYKCINSNHLLAIKIVLFVLHFMMFSINFCVDIMGGECPLVAKVRWADADLLDFLWFESEWGFCSSMMSLLISALAHKWVSLTKPAVILMEVAWCFNSMIFTVFCIYIYPVRLAPQHGWKPFEMSYVHALPSVSSFIMLILTDMVFLKRDYKLGILGFIYICFNGLGTIYKGKPVYSGVYVASW